MKLHKLTREISETYFSEIEKCRKNSKRFWSFLFLAFFASYLFQIYSAYVEISYITDSNSIILDEYWQFKIDAIKIQGIVLTGIFIKFLSSVFRGKWAIRFGEVGELIAFAAFWKHVLWTSEINSQYSNGVYCGSPYLIGMNWIGNWIGLFIFSRLFCKILLVIAVSWKTVRK